LGRQVVTLDASSTVRVVQIPERYSLTVLLPGPPPKAMVLEGRVAKFVAWLVQHRARLERAGVGALVFNFSLNSFTPELHEHFPRQLATPENPDVTDPQSAAS
jgi:hypothetical protein